MKDILSRGDATDRVVSYAATEILFKYDSNGSSPLSYHNGRHTLDVELATHAIGMKAVANSKITHRATTLLKIAASFHDVEQGMGSGANEDESAHIAAKQMEETSAFTPREVEAVKQMILATKVYFEDGVMKQSANTEGLDEEMTCLCMILADADVASLGNQWEICFSRMKALEKEIHGNDPTAKAHKSFLANQLALLENHTFYTPEATALYPHQSENATELRTRLSKLS